MSWAHLCFWICGGCLSVFVGLMVLFYGDSYLKDLKSSRPAHAVASSWPVRFVRYQSGHGKHSLTRMEGARS